MSQLWTILLALSREFYRHHLVLMSDAHGTITAVEVLETRER
ncbi:MAG: hypothetical protein NZ847_18225 [Acidobacteria bacterium]|nr:hypothetical protein [Acidobacteriota bacterium]